MASTWASNSVLMIQTAVETPASTATALARTHSRTPPMAAPLFASATRPTSACGAWICVPCCSHLADLHAQGHVFVRLNSRGRMRTLFFLSSPPLHNFIYFSQIWALTACDAVATLYMFPQILAFMKQVNSGPPNQLDEEIHEPERKTGLLRQASQKCNYMGCENRVHL